MASPEQPQKQPEPKSDTPIEGSYRYTVPEQQEVGKMPTRIYLVRHGESEANLDPLFTGEANLTLKGQLQAKKLGTKLREKGIQFARVITSGRPRTIQTAEAITEQLGKTMPLEVHAGLGEKKEAVRLKKNGQPVAREIEKSLTEQKRASTDQERWTYKPDPNIYITSEYETEQDAAMRLQQAIGEITIQHPGETILVVTHGKLMRALRAALLQKDHGRKTDQEQSVFRDNIYNAGYLAIEAAINDTELKIQKLEEDLNWTKNEEPVVEHLIADFKQESQKGQAEATAKLEETTQKAAAKDKEVAKKEKDKKKKKKPSWVSKQMTNIKNYFQRKIDNFKGAWSDFIHRGPPKLKKA